jgi:hypothetical protein
MESRRKALDEQFDEAIPSLGMVSIMVCIVWLVLPYVFLMEALHLDKWLNAEGMWLNITILCALVLAGLVFPLIVLQRAAGRLRSRHHARITALLKQTDAAQFLLDDTRWEPVFELRTADSLLRYAVPARPLKFAGQLELAADYWRVIVVLTKGDRRRLNRALWLSKISATADKAFLWIFNGCLVWLLMFLGAIFLFVGGALLLIPWAVAFIENLAAEEAILDFLLGARAKEAS